MDTIDKKDEKNKKNKERIEKEQAKRPGIYQSGEHPEHFSNEGGEYVTLNPNQDKDNNNINEEADWEKAHGKKE